jgi:hypothetical protein
MPNERPALLQNPEILEHFLPTRADLTELESLLPAPSKAKRGVLRSHSKKKISKALFA